MTHISIKAANVFALEMVREALAHPIVTFWHPTRMWRHVDITFNDVPAATVTIERQDGRGTITAHCEMEFEGHSVVRGIVELTIAHRTWEFSGYIVDGRMEVHGNLVSE